MGRDDLFWAGDPAVTERGGIVATESLPELEQLNWRILSELLQGAVDEIRATDLAEELQNLTVLLINADDINAFVKVQGSRKLIGLSKGLIGPLWNLLVLLLNHPGVLAGSFEHRPAVAGDRVQTDIRQQVMQLRAGSAPAAMIPEYYDKDRLELATQLYCSILDYVIHHELAHLVRDHSGFLRHRFALSLVEEKPSNITDAIILQSLNLLEIDADLHGLDLQLTSDPDIQDLPQESVEFQRSQQFVHSFTHILAAQFFDLEHASIQQQLLEPHPPPVYRAILFTRALADTFRDLTGLSRAEVGDEHDKAWHEASLCATLLGFPPGRWLGHMDDIDMDRINALQQDYLAFEALINQRNSINEPGLKNDQR